MNRLPVRYRIQVISGAVVLLCIPGIWLAEKHKIPQAPIHILQMIAVLICFVSGLVVQGIARKKLGAFSLAVSGVGIVLTGLYLLLIFDLLFGDPISDLLHRRRFDGQVWRQSADDRSEWPPRLRMVNHLMRSKQLDGLSRQEVIELLGEPFEKDYPAGAADCDIHYYLGPERGLISLDSEWLFITFGEDGKADRYWLYRD